MLSWERDKATLLLKDGTCFSGYSLGAKGTTMGEVVFTTTMTGYQEVLTDPSYYGQIVTQTYPLIGNYGVNREDNESYRSWVKGYIVREWCPNPSNFRCEGTIDEFLKEQNIIGIYGIDTRRLTRIIRETGVMNGIITTEDVTAKKEELLKLIESYEITDAVKHVTTDRSETYDPEKMTRKVVLMDFGYKRNILNNLLSRGAQVTVVPGTATAQEVLSYSPDGIMLTNGPGDPAENKDIIETVRLLSGSSVPIFGICLGHQIMALANGAKTAKLKYGHRGANQPVKDLTVGRTYITSQNHGYAVLSETIPPEVGDLSHINMNDNTCEGIRYKKIPAFTVQFHPEASAGPQDTAYLFDRFFDLMNKEDRSSCR